MKNKEKQIKIGNLGGGEYVGKGKFDSEIEKLNSLLTGKQTEIDAANGLIEQLKKGAKGNEELQGKITQYENTVADLQKQLSETKIKGAVKLALLTEKALDIPYLSFKLDEKMKEKGKTLELDENEKIKGWDELLADLKTQCPNQFESGKGGKIEGVPLPGGDDRKTEPASLADALRLRYEQNKE